MASQPVGAKDCAHVRDGKPVKAEVGGAGWIYRLCGDCYKQYESEAGLDPSKLVDHVDG